MHGLGNDFIVVADRQQLPENAAELAIRLCDRHFGIGADGIVYILPSDRADFHMRIINADGTEAEQCGNAVRCAAKYVYDHRLSRSPLMTVETIGAGVQPLELTVVDGKVAQVKVDMGEPVLDGLKIPTTIDSNPVIGETLEAGGRRFRFTAVSMGNPHCIIYVDDAASVDLHKWGPAHRAPSALSQSRKCRIRYRDQPRAHRNARLGAWSRADFGLRYRSLRDVGR